MISFIFKEEKMKCSKVKRKSISFLDNELGPHERAKVEDHLNSCSICREELNNISEVFASFCRDEEIEPSSQFRNAVLQRIEAHEKSPISIAELFRYMIWKPVVKIAAIVFLTGLLIIPAIVTRSSAATKVLINVEGMTPDCCEPIRTNLRKLTGIRDIEITPHEGVICITLKKGNQVNLKKVEMAICTAGPYSCKDFNVISNSMRKLIKNRRCSSDEK